MDGSGLMGIAKARCGKILQRLGDDGFLQPECRQPMSPSKHSIPFRGRRFHVNSIPLCTIYR